MKLDDICLNNKLTPMTFKTMGHYVNTFQPIYENKICDKLVMNYSRGTNIPSIDIPAKVPVIYSTTTDMVAISALLEIQIANSISIIVNAKHIKLKKSIYYDRNKICNGLNQRIVEHLIIHDITHANKKIIDKYKKLNKVVGE